MKVFPAVLAAWAVLGWLAAAAPAQQTPAGDNAAREEQVETLDPAEEELEVVEPAAVRPGLREQIGRFHVMLIHFPIAWVVLLALVELAVLVTGRAEWSSRAICYLLILTMLSYLPALATGLIHSGFRSGDRDYLALMSWHRNLAIASGVLVATALGLRLYCCNRKVTGWSWGQFALIALAAALALAAAHFGGRMVYGRDFFPF